MSLQSKQVVFLEPWKKPWSLSPEADQENKHNKKDVGAKISSRESFKHSHIHHLII